MSEAVPRTLDRSFHTCPVCFMVFSRKYNAERHINSIHKAVNNNNVSTFENELNEVEHQTEHNFCNNEVSQQIRPDIYDTNRTTISADENIEKVPPQAVHIQHIDNIGDSDDSDDDFDTSENDSDEENNAAAMEIDSLEHDNDWLFNQCSEHSVLTIKDHAAAIMGFSVRHNCSREAVRDLLTLIDLHLPQNNNVLKSYGALKNCIRTFSDDNIKLIEYCEMCYNVWPDDENSFQCLTDGCSGRRYRGSAREQERKHKKCFFFNLECGNRH